MATQIPPFPKRRLGRGGPEVTAIGYGGMGLSTPVYGSFGSDEERFKVLDAVIETGVTFIDTSDIYGDSEELLVKWFNRNPGLREKIFLATKFGIVIPEGAPPRARGDAAYAKECAEKAIEKFGYVDLLYVHWIDSKIPIEETISALAEFVKAGKIKHLGLSECSSNTLRRAYKIHPIIAIQVEYSLFALDIETPGIGLLRTARDLGVSIVPFSPLGRGLLTGRFKSPDDFEEGDYRRLVPRYSKENFPKNLALVDKVAAIGAQKGSTPSQTALAWILAQGADFIPIPGSKNIKYIKENNAAINAPLSLADIQTIREYAEATQAPNERYPDFLKHLQYGSSAPA